MNINTVKSARTLAERFIRKADAILDNLGGEDEPSENHWPITGTKETGALRRASLDLTRALAEMRKS